MDGAEDAAPCCSDLPGDLEPLIPNAQDADSLDVLRVFEELKDASAQVDGLEAIATTAISPENMNKRPRATPGAYNPNRARRKRKNKLV